jgi:hypothetical protein
VAVDTLRVGSAEDASIAAIAAHRHREIFFGRRFGADVGGYSMELGNTQWFETRIHVAARVLHVESAPVDIDVFYRRLALRGLEWRDPCNLFIATVDEGPVMRSLGTRRNRAAATERLS